MNFEKYPFEKLNELLKDVVPNDKFELSALTIGEPKFETPQFIQDKLKETTPLLRKYPSTVGEVFLRESMINFVKNRFNVSLEINQIVPTFGTREVLFNFPQFALFDKENPVIAFTNPFYQIYEGAAIASRA
ncbi:MAG: aminotransferase class I/II-fold pyridoxal phosphate-dependent enzyme, partial [Arcobacter sp.]